jgi:hypothetical protein
MEGGRNTERPADQQTTDQSLAMRPAGTAFHCVRMIPFIASGVGRMERAMLAPLRGKHANDRCLPTTENANNMGGPTTWWSGRAATGSHTIRVQTRKPVPTPGKSRPERRPLRKSKPSRRAPNKKRPSPNPETASSKMPRTGLEPAWGCPRQPLKLVRLPFRHLG